MQSVFEMKRILFKLKLLSYASRSYWPDTWNTKKIRVKSQNCWELQCYLFQNL